MTKRVPTSVKICDIIIPVLVDRYLLHALYNKDWKKRVEKYRGFPAVTAAAAAAVQMRCRLFK